MARHSAKIIARSSIFVEQSASMLLNKKKARDYIGSYLRYQEQEFFREFIDLVFTSLRYFLYRARGLVQSRRCDKVRFKTHRTCLLWKPFRRNTKIIRLEVVLV